MPPTTITIRPVRLDDAGQLFALLLDFTTSIPPERAAFDTNLPALLDDPDVWFYAAVRENDVVGYCLGFDKLTLYASGRVAWVAEIMIRQDQRGQGVGRTLMHGFEDWSRARAARMVALATRRAAPFYLALGYDESAAYFRKLL